MTEEDTSPGRHARFALASGFFLIPVVAVFSSKAMVPLLGLLFLTLVFYGPAGGLNPKEWPRWLFIGLVLLIGLGALSCQWSVSAVLSLKVIGPIAALAGMGLITYSKIIRLSRAEANTVGTAFAAGMAVALVIVLFEGVTLSWITRQVKGISWPDVLENVAGGRNLSALLKAGVSLLTLFFWPLILVLMRRRKWVPTGLAGTVLLFAIFHANATTALLALVLGALAALAGYRYPRMTGRLIAALVVIAILFMPLILKPVTSPAVLASMAEKAETSRYSPSVFARLNIWQFTIEKIEEKPLTGWGMNTSRKIPGGDQKRDIYQDSGSGQNRLIYRDFNLPLHPHNQALQVWLELGLLGAILIAAVVGGMIWRFANRGWGDGIASFAYGLVVSVLTFNFLSFGAWQNWWVAAQFLAFILLAGGGRAFRDND